MKKSYTFYISVLVAFVFLIWLILKEGERKNPITTGHNQKTEITNNTKINDGNCNTIQKEELSVLDNTINTLKKQLSSPLTILLVQIIIIVILSRILGISIGKLGQPIVIGEIIAGIILGPSFLGSIFPETFRFIFPANSLNNLQLFSQFGLVLFMFIIGMEIDSKHVQRKINSALIISYTGIIFPFFLGTFLSFFIYSTFAMPGVNFTTFALFIGVAMSITAFPVLARIIHEKGLTKTPLGNMVLACAATDDITAWLIFAAIIAIAQAGTALNAVFVIIIAIMFVISMLFIIQPILKRIGNIYVSSENLSKTVIAFIFLILFSSAFFTEMIGIHALFGAFIAGVIVPKNLKFKKLMINKIEDVSTVVLLPLFFAFTGLRTQIGSLNTPYLWAVCGIVILMAVIGKLGGISIAARFVGNTWRDSVTMGVLMNTRGLMELIVLNIGYDLGILSTEIFSIMVLMALTTTFMAGPFLSFLEKSKKRNSFLNDKHDNYNLKVLISFGIPKMGASILRLIFNFMGRKPEKGEITALHLTPQTEISQIDALKYETSSFAPIKTLANQLNIPINTIYKTSEDVTKEIVKTVKREKCNFLVIGAARSIFTNNMLGGRVRTFITQGNCNVGVFIDKDFKDLKKTLLISGDTSIPNMLGMMRLLAENSTSEIKLADTLHFNENYPDIVSYIETQKKRMEIITPQFNESDFFNQYDLVIISFRFFEKNFKNNPVLLDSTASLLIVNFHDDRFQEIFSTNI
jgi:Kef-type K+ transport system membrane component KefB/uncharacterized protein YdcH (DUF465 family)